MSRIGNILLVSALAIIGLVVAGALLFCIVEVFHLTGTSWDWLRSCVDSTWLEKYQGFVAGIIGASLLLAAAIFAILQLRATRRISYAALLVKLAMDWNSEEFIKSRKRILEVAPIELSEVEQRSKLKEQFLTAQKERAEDFFILTKPLDFFEDLAFLIRKHYIPMEDVRRTFGDAMVVYHDIFKECIDELRSLPENKNAYRELEEVTKQLKKQRPPNNTEESKKD